MRNTKQSKFIPCYELPLRVCLSSSNNKVQVTCDRGGNVSSANTEKSQWEEWMILPDSLSSCVPEVILLKSLVHGYYLGSNEYGQVVCIRKEEADDEDKWIISPSPRPGSFFLSSYVHRRKLAWDEYGYIFTTESNGLGGTLEISWNVEFQSGELCYMYSPECHKKIRCNLTGQVKLTDSYDGWEVWRFIETGCKNEVYISSWAHDNKYLSSDVDGNVCTSENKTLSERWMIEKDHDGRNGVLIKSAVSSRYLHCVINVDDEEMKLQTLKTFDEESAIWQLSEGHRNNFLISSVKQDKRLSAFAGTKASISKYRNRQENFQIEFFPDGFCTIYSPLRNKYLSSNSNGTVSISSNANEWEKWRIEETAFGEYFIVSVVHRRYLACNQDGELHTSKNYDDSEMWYLEPNMPRRFNKQSIIALSVAGVVGISTAYLMPTAVVAVIRGVGFGASGIAAGSTAASMMSAEAVASGGAIASGGLVATLQSVGAAGCLGAVGTGAAMAVGGTVGGTIAGATLKGTLDNGADDVTPNENILVCSNRPFCAWKYWS